MRRVLAFITLAGLLAACASPGATPSGTPGGQPSGTAACPTAPAVADDLPGWGPPASAPTVIPQYIAPAPTACGDNRVLFSFLDTSNRPVAAPDRSARVAFYDLARDTDTPFATVDGTFVWAIENAVGIYVAHVRFPEAGRFGVEFITAAAGGSPETIRMTIDVQPSTPVVRVGDKAPSTKTPTLADVGNDPAKISTDPTPDPDLYRTSIDQALAEHKPFVVIFATPKFCQTGQCGPTLERIKPFVSKYPTVTFINVEPYKLKFEDGSLQADLDAKSQLQATQATNDWHLLSEPNVYVVNRDGIVTANFELIFSDTELTAALDAIK